MSDDIDLAPVRQDIRTLIRNRYPEPEYAVLFEVSDSTGGRTRSADAIAMSLWPSRGLTLHGMEIKSYRSDWLRELKNPKKAELIFQHCDYWWIVADGKDIVKPEELPKTWGLLERRGNRLFVVKAAPELKPKNENTIARHFVAAMLRRSTEGMIPKRSVQDEIEAAVVDRTKHNEYEIGRLRQELLNREKAIADFEKASGVRIHEWDAGKVGEVVNLVRNGGARKIVGELEDVKRQVARLNETIKLLEHHV